MINKPLSAEHMLKRWPVGATLALAITLIGVVVSVILPSVYEAKALILVSNPPAHSIALQRSDLKLGNIRSQDLSAETAVAEFATSDSAAQMLAATISPRAGDQLDAHPVLGASLVELIVRGTDPQRVAAVGAAWARLVKSQGSTIFPSESHIALRLIADTVVPRYPVAPKRWLMAANAAVLGGIAGLVAMLIVAEWAATREPASAVTATESHPGDEAPVDG